MTAKEYLQKVRNIGRDIISVSYDMAEIKEQKEGLKSVEISERVQTSVTYTNHLDNLLEREEQLLEERNKLVNLWWDCRKLINRINNKELVEVLSYYYLRGKHKRNRDGEKTVMTWDDVANKMHTSTRQIYRLHGEALQEFRKISGMK